MRASKNATNVYSIREAKFVEQKEKIQVDKSDIRFEQILHFSKDYDQIFNNIHSNPSINRVEILEFLVKTCGLIISGLLWVRQGRHK